MSNEIKEQQNASAQTNTKFCKYCGAKIQEDAIICTACGRQVEEMKQAQTAQPQIIINNDNHNINTNTNTNNVNAGVRGVAKNKWVALALCILLGYFGAHKFYEGKIGAGVLYIFTCGLFGIGWIVDIIALLAKPNPYYV